jgi:RNA polymerase sigma factor (sigma-70 family)
MWSAEGRRGVGDSEDRTARHRVGDEAELIERARAGDQQAFATLVEPHRSMLTAVCYRIVGDEGAAEDALQETLVAAWRHLDRFQGRSKFSTWLYRIAHNAALASARKAVAEPIDALERGIAGGPAVDETVSDVRSVRWALARIPPDFRAALVLREFSDMSYDEIARAQGIKIETVKTRISRARQALALLLADD